MIVYKPLETFSILDSQCQALVNPVNCVGVMGAGLAFEFKSKYPDMFWDYKAHCESGSMHLGIVRYYPLDGQYILNFPTKYHWRDKSKLEDIESGLDYLIGLSVGLKLKSIAFPLLGCGLGGLEPKPVVDLLLKYSYLMFLDLVEIYAPGDFIYNVGKN